MYTVYINVKLTQYTLGKKIISLLSQVNNQSEQTNVIDDTF